ncbi:hypothetical protein [Deinococcus arenicola]|uniref:Uncharacterized protein n=1 Tax=Deinococcus arenicola TaxID=2994950 RepID=A0ABU4DMX9_9DEIO|nr:hypothetical protein [Deinococcus sp. ZS9-10]MDV6373312.1 hypothetical protein [Deinococcus sp. ZS9-10]
MTESEGKMVMLSDYVGTLRNGKYVNGERLIKAVEANNTSQKSPLFAKIFPVPNYFTVETGEGVFTVKRHDNRSDSSKYRKDDTAIKSHRDYFILDIRAFETFLDENTDTISYLRTPSGFDSGKKAGAKFYTPEYLMSLSPDEAAKIAAEMAKDKLNKPKREMTEEHKKKVQTALAKARKEKNSK